MNFKQFIVTREFTFKNFTWVFLPKAFSQISKYISHYTCCHLKIILNSFKSARKHFQVKRWRHERFFNPHLHRKMMSWNFYFYFSHKTFNIETTNRMNESHFQSWFSAGFHFPLRFKHHHWARKYLTHKLKRTSSWDSVANFFSSSEHQKKNKEKLNSQVRWQNHRW